MLKSAAHVAFGSACEGKLGGRLAVFYAKGTLLKMRCLEGDTGLT
jgi:hypothetical protein